MEMLLVCTFIIPELLMMAVILVVVVYCAFTTSDFSSWVPGARLRKKHIPVAYWGDYAAKSTDKVARPIIVRVPRLLPKGDHTQVEGSMTPTQWGWDPTPVP